MTTRPKTRLELYVSQFIKLPPGEVLTRLQNAGIASDNCLTLGDVFEVRKALEWVVKELEE